MSPASQPAGVDDQTEAEINAHMEGPVSAARTFLELLRDGRLDEAWALADPEWRLARIQRHLWTARDFLPEEMREDFLPEEMREEAAALAATDRPTGSPWAIFANHEIGGWVAALEGFDAATWGAGTRPHAVEIDYELVGLAETGGKAWATLAELKAMNADVKIVLLHLVDGRWLVAALDVERYLPGWPPTRADGTPIT